MTDRKISRGNAINISRFTKAIDCALGYSAQSRSRSRCKRGITNLGRRL